MRKLTTLAASLAIMLPFSVGLATASVAHASPHSTNSSSAHLRIGKSNDTPLGSFPIVYQGSVSSGPAGFGRQPNATEICDYGAGGPGEEEVLGQRLVTATATLTCSGGDAKDVRFYGCIQHSMNGTTAWGNDLDSCTPAGGDLYAHGNAVKSADWNYIHDCVAHGLMWHYRLRYRITGVFTLTGGPFDTNYQLSAVTGLIQC